MELKTFIFIGCSGCGKGTQAELIQEYLKKESSGQELLYVEAGERFREFLKNGTYASKLSKDIYMNGDLQPAFLSIWVWADLLIHSLKEKMHLILDGSPRKLNEAHVIHEALQFYKRENPYVVFIDVSRDWATERLRGRNREDDKDDDNIKKRLDWFEKDVMPAIEFFRENPYYNFLEINGQQSIEDVHKEIIEKFKFDLN
ncbi:MAG: nucleoside monophosphate kinase [Candidatus Paceibacteria bacterium]